jgi:hypothetical protein
VLEDAAARSLVFRLVKSSFMRDFEGRWQVHPAAALEPAAAAAAVAAAAGGGSSSSSDSGAQAAAAAPPRARVEHVLAVKPIMPIPGAVARYTAGIFTRQVANILRDLEKEISAKAAAAGGGGGGGHGLPARR